MLDTIIFAGVSWGQVAVLVAWVLGSMIFGKLLQLSLVRLALQKALTDHTITQVALNSSAKPILLLFFLLGLRQGMSVIALGERFNDFAADLFSVLLTVSITYFVFSMISVIDSLITRFTNKTPTTMDDMMAPMVRKSLRVVVVVLGGVQIAQILSEKPITSIIAGLGVGGLAVALAAQETIKNFFGSLVIFADKPFELGHRVLVGGHDGTIEDVGFRSTRIRTLDGHMVTVPNGELANLMIQNIGRRPFIKRVMNITITYNTPPEKVQLALDIIKGLLENHEGMEEEFPPRIYFSDFNDCSLNIKVIYWYHPPQYWDYMAHAEKLNMDILRRYNEESIEFAFPTQTVHLHGAK